MMDLKRSIVIEIDAKGAVVGARKVEDALRGIDNSARNVGSQSTRGINNLSGAIGGLAKMLPALVAGFGALKTADFVKDAALLAARYDTLAVTMGVVGRNAGYTAQNMVFYEEALRKTGITAIEARASLASMASANMDLADSAKLARIAQDAAVIGGINSSEAFQRLTYGIKSAQVEVLRTMGINVSFENSYKKLADQLGKTSAELSESEKLFARTNVVMEAGENISGAYAASMETAGKKLQSTTRLAEDARVKLGQIFQPALIAFVDAYTAALKLTNEQLDKLIGYLDKFNVQSDVSGQTMGTLARRYREQAEAYKNAEEAQRALLAGKTTEEQQQIMRTQRWRSYNTQLARAEETMRAVRREMALLTEQDRNQSREVNAQRTIKSKSEPGASAEPESATTAAAIKAAQAAYAKMIADGRDAALALEIYWTDYEDARVAAITEGVEARAEAEAKNLELITEFADKYKEIVLGETAFKVSQIEAQAEAYRTAGADEIAVAKWVEAEKQKVSRDWQDGAVRALEAYADASMNAAALAEQAFTNGFQSMEDALVDFVMTGKTSFSDLIESMISDLARLAIQQSITGPLAKAASSFDWSKLFSGGASSGSASTIAFSGVSSAKGNVFGSDGLHAYANSIVSSPTIFPFARGVGLMGEAGPEAIMPLKRGPDGVLGVRADGGGMVVNIIESPGNGGRTQQRQENGVNILDVMVEQIKSSIASDINRGSGVVPQAITKSYGLSRAPGAY
jgi:lambda family phage tail tape measure protein